MPARIPPVGSNFEARRGACDERQRLDIVLATGAEAQDARGDDCEEEIVAEFHSRPSFSALSSSAFAAGAFTSACSAAWYRANGEICAQQLEVPFAEWKIVLD